MKKINIVLILLIATISMAGNEIALNFFINPQFRCSNIDSLSIELEKITQDSVMSMNIFAGDLFFPVIKDSVVIENLEKLPGMLYSPNDYQHYYREDKPGFGLLASNIQSDSILIAKNFKLSNDSLKIGIFTIYTPDIGVKQQYANGVHINGDVIDETIKQTRELKKSGCNYIIMLTSLSSYVVNYIIKEVELDGVISYDYKTEKVRELQGKKTTGFYSIASSQGKYGRLLLTKAKDGIIESWQECRWQNAKGN